MYRLTIQKRRNNCNPMKLDDDSIIESTQKEFVSKKEQSEWLFEQLNKLDGKVSLSEKRKKNIVKMFAKRDKHYNTSIIDFNDVVSGKYFYVPLHRVYVFGETV